jgi:aspartate-semialdehyde dehydrogenase
MRVGLIGWRGMVGSVLMQRMREERDFDLIEPVFFTTSQVGGKAPDVGREVAPLKDARNIDELAGLLDRRSVHTADGKRLRDYS